MTEGEAEAAVQRAVRRIRAMREHRTRTGALPGPAAADVIPEPGGARARFGVNLSWLRIARQATKRAATRETRRSPNMGRIET